MNDLVLKEVQALINGRFERCDIGIAGGRVSKIDPSCSLAEEGDVLQARGLYASPGWVDLHVHAISLAQKSIGTDVSKLGAAVGVTAVLDAGTVGPANFSELKEKAVNRSPVPVYSLLNIKRLGIRVLDNFRVKPGMEDLALMERVLAGNKGIVRGIKTRASAEDVVRGDPLYYVRKCREAGDLLKLPVMIHIGPTPPDIGEILPYMKEGDIVTHFLRKESHDILRNGKVREEVWEAKKRGVRFDVGHGFNSFAFSAGQKALDQGFDDFTISTDQWFLPDLMKVRTFANVLTKFLALGMSLEAVMDRASTRAAKTIGIEREIAEGKPAAITVFSTVTGDFPVKDTVGDKRISRMRIIPEWTIYEGKKFKAGDIDRKLFLGS